MSAPTYNISSTTFGMTSTTTNLKSSGTTTIQASQINLNGALSFSSFLKTQTILTGSRTFNTNYQNTKTTPLFINITFQAGAIGEVFIIRCDSIPSPTNTIIYMPIYSHSSSTFFIVPPSYYYRFEHSSSGGIQTICEWS